MRLKAHTMRFLICGLILFLVSPTISLSQTDDGLLRAYDVTWTSQSRNSSESMPCGGGSIGLNVWVENNDLLLYVSKSDAFEENNGLYKLGRVRVRVSPNPFEGAEFTQQLHLNDGYVEVSATKGNEKTRFDVWVDVFRPVIHIDMESSIGRTVSATYESWRTVTFKERPDENFQNSLKWAPFDTIYTYRDSIAFQDKSILFFHRNQEYTVFDANVSLQGLDNVKDQLYNPIKNNTYGGVLSGEDMVPAGNTSGKYVETEFKGWTLQSRKPVQKQNIELCLFTKQTATLDEWKNGLAQVVADAKTNNTVARTRTRDWWHQYWNRSHIAIDADKSRNNSKQWQVGRNYQLFRYMLGCNAYGTAPTKFNGGLFTFDPVFVDTSKHFTADYRNWCGGTMTAQNQRLVYFPMLASGDIDMMKPQFDFYLKGLRNVEIRSEQVWGHKGAGFTEQLETYGLSNPAEYGWKRPAGFDKGYDYNAWLEYLWDTSLEFCFMILETNRYENRDITGYIPLIESCLTFYDEHYQYLALKRGIKALDGDGKLILYPSSGCETYKMAYNSTSTIAALKTVLEHLLALPGNYLGEAGRKKWTEMLGRIPPISYARIDGHVTIAPAQAYERIQNVESPQLYPVYPWGMFGIGKPGLDTALNTWTYDPKVVRMRGYWSWKQDNIWAARLGLTDSAAALTIKKLQDGIFRFPAFFGQGYDWTPDHNWGGSGMIGLQEMLMQTTDDRIFLLPSWPKDWDVDFKLHAPRQTVVEARVKDGKIVSLKVTPASRRSDIIVNEKFQK
jgi:hypothetical protein